MSNSHAINHTEVNGKPKGLLKNIKLRSNIAIGFSVILLLFIAVTLIGINRVNIINSALININEINSIKQRYAINFRDSVHDRAISLRDVVLVNTQKELNQSIEEIRILSTAYEKSAILLDKMFAENKDIEPIEHEILANIKDIEAKTLPLIERVIQLQLAGDKDAAYEILIKEARPKFRNWLQEINRFIDLQEKKSHIDANIATAISKQFQSTMLLACGISVLLGCLFAMWGISALRPLQPITNSLLRLAEGDTQVEIPVVESLNEVGQIAKVVYVFQENILKIKALDAERTRQELAAEEKRRATMHQMADSFESSVKGMLFQVVNSAKQMEEGAENLTHIADDTKIRSSIVVHASNEAAETSSQMAAAAEQLTASINEISLQTQKSSQVATEAASKAEHAKESINLLNEKSTRVGEIIEVITGIAGQINLLALNATIESARAGEAGRGFAVVASEVKKLADQVGKATDEIVKQINDMQGATQTSVNSVLDILQIISQVSTSTTAVAAAVEEQSAVTNEIAQSVVRTSSGTQEISRNMVSVQNGAEATGKTSQEVLEFAKSLSDQSNQLKEKAEEFLTTIRKT